MSRRGFVGSTLAAAAVLGCGKVDAAADAQAGAAVSQPPTPAFALDELTIDALQARMKSGQDTSASLVQQYLARIDAIDQRGPAINSVIELNPDATTIARQLDDE